MLPTPEEMCLLLDGILGNQLARAAAGPVFHFRLQIIKLTMVTYQIRKGHA